MGISQRLRQLNVVLNVQVPMGSPSIKHLTMGDRNLVSKVSGAQRGWQLTLRFNFILVLQKPELRGQM